MRRARDLLAAIAISLGLGGCLPLPFVAPPLRIGIGVGAAIGNIVPSSEKPAAGTATEEELAVADRDAHTMVQARLGIRPLGVVPDLEERSFDFELGYVLDAFAAENTEPYNRHGGYLGVSHYPLINPLGRGWTGRLGIDALGEVLTIPSGEELGGGAAIRVNYSFLRYGQGVFLEADYDGAMLGGAIGEYGISLGVEGGMRVFQGSRYGFVTGNLSFHFPAAAGVWLVPLSRLR